MIRADWSTVIGVLLVIIVMVLIVILPFICTIILGTYLATALGLTGFVWWSFVLIFMIFLYALLGFLYHAWRE